MLKSHQIAVRLGISFSALLATLIAVGWLFLHQMDRDNARLAEIQGKNWTTLTMTQEALRYSGTNSRITMQLFLLQDEDQIKALLTTRAENSKRIETLLGKVEESCHADDEKKLIAAIKSSRQAYTESYARALHSLLDERNGTEAKRIMAQETTPAMFSYHSAYNDLVQLEVDQIDKATNERRLKQKSTHRLVLSAIVLSVFLTGIIAFITARRIILETTEQLTNYEKMYAERVEAEERLRLWSRVLEQSGEGIFVCDPHERILLVNTAFEKLTGFSADEALGKTPRMFQSGRQDRAFYADLWRSVAETGAWCGEMWNRRKSGELYVQWLSIGAVRDPKGVVTHYVGIFSDITIRKQAEDRLVHLAHYDALTDLPNRILLLDRLNELIKSAQRNKSKVAVVFIDLDRFKEVNDSLGHDAGDLLLQTLAKRLTSAVRDQDTVARMGGDEFIVLIQGLHDVKDVPMLVQKLLSCLVESVTLNGYELTVTASMGISLYPDDATNGPELIRNADAAMYQAKDAGRNAYRFYTSDLNLRALEMLSMENSLRRAIERKEFVLHYQPQVDIKTGSVVGAEALIRWNHPDLGLVMPGKFIPIAEERGLIVPIGGWVIEEAARQAAIWHNSGISMPIAVNVSAVQFRQKDFAEELANSVRKHGITPDRLELELTESILMRDAETTIKVLQKLHDVGFQLSIDDFGTGYSSLSYLRRFPIGKIKIDQSFIRTARHDDGAASIVIAIIALAQSLKLKVIAEGVETTEQLEILRAQGCDQAQGFLFSRGLGSEEFQKFAREWNPQLLRTPEFFPV